MSLPPLLPESHAVSPLGPTRFVTYFILLVKKDAHTTHTLFNEKSGKENRVTQELGDKGNTDIIK